MQNDTALAFYHGGEAGQQTLEHINLFKEAIKAKASSTRPQGARMEAEASLHEYRSTKGVSPRLSLWDLWS